MSNHQETFNQVVKFALKQNDKSIEFGTCLYRGPDNTRCFVGAFIPEDLYDKSMEGKDAEDLINQFPELYNHLSIYQLELYEAIEFWGRMQGIHDDYEISGWSTQFEKYATEYKLQYNE